MTVPLHKRLGVSLGQVESVDLLSRPVLPDANTLFTRCFERAKSSPEEANILLGAALLAQARQTSEGRLSAALALLAKLVSRADPMMTLGPSGSDARDFAMPNGWRYTAQSWHRLRYAWREPGGLKFILGVQPGDDVADALDEVTRISPAEPEPVSVAIQESFPPPKIGFAITIIGLGISFYGIHRSLKREREIDAKLNRMNRRRK